MLIPEIIIEDNDHLPVDRFSVLDHLSVEKYGIIVELMMENAGFQLARLVTNILPLNGNILIGAGPGNNGGGG